MPVKKGIPERVKRKKLDDLFSIEEDMAQIQEIPLKDLHGFRDHPFKVLDDERMEQMIESIRENGIIHPGLARPRDAGGYELISGHRRKHAAEIAGLETMPLVIKELTDDEAIIVMVDANLQREEILPSEKAFAYKMKLEAIDRRLGRPKEGQVVPEYLGMKSTEIVAEGTGESYKQIQRYIRLTELIPDLLELADLKRLKLNPAVELSYLSEDEQKALLDEMEAEDIIPSLYQAKQIKRLSNDGMCTKEAIHAILVVAPEKDRRVTIKQEKIKKFFSADMSDKEIEDTIYRVLEEWYLSQKGA